MPTPGQMPLLAEATAQTNELVNEHEIMQKAYAHANEVIEQAQAQARPSSTAPSTTPTISVRAPSSIRTIC